MRRIIPFLFALFVPLAYSQATRVDLPLLTSGPKIPAAAVSGPLPQALWVSNSKAYLCTHPQTTLAACQANPITTYTDVTEGTPCGTTTQLVQLPGTTCTNSTGVVSNLGAWVGVTTFDYFLITSYGTFGPFTWATPASIFNGGTITNPLTAPSYLIPGCPAGQFIKGDGTGCGAGGTAANPAGSNTQVQINGGGIFDADSVFTYNKSLHSLGINNSLSALTPWSDIRNPTYAGLCNGSNADETAVQAAINAAMGAGGSGVVFIPDGCKLSNASGLTNPASTKNLMIEMQGNINANSTFVVPVGASLKCLGKGPVYQFANGTPTCTVNAPQAHGTMGTATTSTNTLVTFTPTFPLGSIANLPVGSAITVAGVETCATSGATRTALGGSFPGGGPTNTTYNITTCVDSSGNPIAFGIPPASKLTATNCSDSSFNTPTGGLFSNISDFGTKTIGVRMVGSGATIADTSCVIVGFNRDSWDTCRIEAQSGSTVSCRFNHVHAASDLWGEVGMALTFNDRSDKLIEGIGVTNNWGVGLWLDNNVTDFITGSSFTGIQYLTSTALEESSGFGLIIDKSQTTSFSAYICPTAGFNCGDIGPPWTQIYDMLPQSLVAQNAIASVTIQDNSFIRTGIYITTNGSGPAYENGPNVNNTVFEEPMWNGITFDCRNVNNIFGTTLNNTLMQDNVVNWSAASYVGMTDNCLLSSGANGQVAFYNATNMNYGPNGNSPPNPTTVNKYFCGQIEVAGSQAFNNLIWPACPEATVTFHDGKSFAGENATPPVGPTYIPFTTSAATITAASWTCANITGSGCTLTAGQLDPWGGTNAAQFFAGTGFASSGVASYAGATATGDVFLYGVWARTTDPNSYPYMSLTTFGADTFDVNNSLIYAPAINNFYYHSIIGMAIVTAGSASGHTVAFSLNPGTGVAATAYFSDPFLIRIPASANIPMDEIRRWRSTMLHGYVPASFTGPGFAFPPGVAVSGPGFSNPFSAIAITSHAGTLATAGAAFTNGTVTLDHTSTTTINVSGLVSGANFNIRLTQDSSGANTVTMGTGCTWLLGGGSGFVASTTPTLTAAASGINVLSAIYDGTNCMYNIR